MGDTKRNGLPSVTVGTDTWWPGVTRAHYWQRMTLHDLCALVSVLDDEGKREVFRALGGMVEVLRFMPECKDEPAFEGPEPLL